MLFQSELRRKIETCLPQIERHDGKLCLEKALALYDLHGGGEIYWIDSLEKIGSGESLLHAYFVPPNSKPNDIALNQSDNGFPQYPRLTVKEVKYLDNNPMNPEIIRARADLRKN